MYHTYEKYKEDGTLQYCPANDYDGSITGHIVINVRAWFDENPEERIRLGWIKHIKYEQEDLKKIEYDPQTQYLIVTTRAIDEYTIEDEYHTIEKSEEMMALEEMLEVMNIYVPAGHVILDAQGGVLV